MARQMETRRKYGTYIEGTAVRKTNYEVQQTAAPRTYVEDERVSVTKEVYRNREKALHMNLSYVIVLGICSLVIFFTCVQYLSLQESIASRKANIVALESQTNTLKSRNDAIDYAINSYIDIENITKVATEELGMIRATEEQICFYESSEYEYMKQFKDVPTNE
jgi:cell division protein FtsB